MLQKLVCKIAIFMIFEYELYYDGFYSYNFETLHLSNPLIVTHKFF